MLKMSTMMECKKGVALLSGRLSNKFLRTALVTLSGISVISLFFYARKINILNSSKIGGNDRFISRQNTTEQIRSFSSKEPVDNLRRDGKKIFIAFDYWEQLTMATNNFLDLTALAAYGGRQVVVPFVKDSKFVGSPTEKGFETLALYYNVTALNNTLGSRGLGTLISWKEFQNLCHGKLDALVYFDYTPKIEVTQPFWPCKDRQRNAFGDFKVERTICINVFAVDSVETFENEIVKRLPCVGLPQWRGNIEGSLRAQFNLSSVVTHRMQSADAGFFFSSKLLHVAQDFIVKNLGPVFFSVHIRAESIIKFETTLKLNIASVKKCISNLSTLVQRYKNVSTAHIPVFLAADFTDYGSSSARAKTARKNTQTLMKVLAPLKPVLFKPSAYNLTDRGVVAIVEMSILVSGKKLFVVGGGSFQAWIVRQFLDKNHIDRKATAICKNELCNSLCYF